MKLDAPQVLCAFEEGMQPCEIATAFGVTEERIRALLKRNGIKLESLQPVPADRQMSLSEQLAEREVVVYLLSLPRWDERSVARDRGLSLRAVKELIRLGQQAPSV